MRLQPNTKAHDVMQVIAEQSMDCAQRFEVLFLKSMFIGTTDNELVLLNRFWRHQLSRLPIPTYEERHCLSDEVNFGPWLVNFRAWVVPTIVLHNLPKPEV